MHVPCMCFRTLNTTSQSNLQGWGSLPIQECRIDRKCLIFSLKMSPLPNLHSWILIIVSSTMLNKAFLPTSFKVFVGCYAIYPSFGNYQALLDILKASLKAPEVREAGRIMTCTFGSCSSWALSTLLTIHPEHSIQVLITWTHYYGIDPFRCRELNEVLQSIPEW